MLEAVNADKECKCFKLFWISTNHTNRKSTTCTHVPKRGKERKTSRVKNCEIVTRPSDFKLDGDGDYDDCVDVNDCVTNATTECFRAVAH